MAPLMVAFAPAAKIEAKVTSATPIMSAAAVTAVRPGWRTEFSRASWPVMPVARSIGRPMTFASGRTSRGESSATPMKVSAAPPPMNEIAALSDFRLPKSPTHMSPTPIASSSPAPMAIRRPRPRCIGTTPSRRASTGGTRMARIAGAMLATRLTTVPTRIVTITVRLSMTTPLLGRSAPNALNSARRSAAVPMPSRKPTTPPTKPSVSPSLTTARQIWRRDAPRVRSSANSRMRWATVIEKVLKIRKAPTNSAMKANASRKVFRNPRLSRMSLDSLSACS